ncbi:MAG: zf-HC2 domain-containing protein [Acidobacteria bacterium]|nr:zf-HC2 domain-containing protein [Acidobacteriota bacterium]
MNCQQSQTVLLDYLLEEISTGERGKIQEHLGSCDSCTAELERLRQTVALLVRGEPKEEIPRQIRLVAEPVGRWAGFWRSGSQVAFAGSALACLAIAVLALFHTTISYQQGKLDIAFGVRPASQSLQPALAASQPASAAPGLDREEVLRLISQAVADSESRQQAHAAQVVQATLRQGEQRRAQDLRDMAESLRYFQAAQTILWKEQVESQDRVNTLLRQVGLPKLANPAF